MPPHVPWKRALATGLALLPLSLPAASPDAEAAALRFFENKVRPLLAERCYSCHGEEKQKSGLRVDHRAYLVAGGDSGPAIVPGDLGGSLLIEAVRRIDEDTAMPPREKDALPEAEVAILEQWIESGAPWPADPGSPDTEELDEFGFSKSDRAWWSFQPVREPEVPGAGGAWVRNSIDAFVARKLAETGLRPAPEAEPEELARRIAYNLTGLPPEPGSEKEIEALIETSLASPHYGERWGQHWLDVVRYAESDGYRADDYRSSVWPYRDYVIRSLNADKPYDQFVREQLAGDEIAPDDPDILIGTAFLRHGIYEWNQRDAVTQWDGIVNEVTDVTSDVFLGLSMGCARCHNHKFDPILQKDYFRLKAFFSPLWWRDDVPLTTPEERAAHEAEMENWRAANAETLAELAELTKESRAKGIEYATKIFPDDVEAMIRKPAAERTPYEQQLATLSERQLRKQAEKDESKLGKEEKARYEELKKILADSGKPRPLPRAFVATDVAPEAPPTIMEVRKKGVEIEPGFLTILTEGLPVEIPEAPEESTGRRSALAEWITDPGNPLTARVIVNRVWQWHFGSGIVATASDFGDLGDEPSHPELLDWLAHVFVHEYDWSLKRLHRLILDSATYRQTARREPSETALKIDPGNALLWRFPPRRLDAAEIRDSILVATSGLDRKLGGPSVDGTSPRRSVYVKRRRNTPDAFLGLFDTPSGFGSIARRDSTTTPGQSLTLVNSAWTIGRSRSLARKIAASPLGERIDRLWSSIYGSPPTDAERASATAFLQQQVDFLKAKTAKPPEPKPSTDARPPFSPEAAAPRPSQSITIEALIQLDSLFENASVRTIVSRWNGGKDPSDHGWSFGITSKQSRYEPRNLILQLVGKDFQNNTVYEVVASDLRVPLGVPVWVAVEIEARPSGEDETTGVAHFAMRDLSKPESAIERATVEHPIVGNLEEEKRRILLGGREGGGSSHRFDGTLQKVRLASGRGPTALPAEPFGKLAETGATLVPLLEAPVRIGGEPAKPKATLKPEEEALADLAQVLMSSNRFLYLH